MNREFIVFIFDMAIVVIAFATILGQSLGLQPFYDWGGAVGGMAVNTAVCLLALASGQALMAYTLFRRRTRTKENGS